MFNVSINSPIKVSFCGTFKGNDGANHAYIKCRECDNQPSDAEYVSKSKDSIMFYLDELPTGVVAGGYITVDSIVGFSLRHVPVTDDRGNKLVDKYGNAMFSTMIVVEATGVAVFPPEEKGTKKDSKKA